MKIKIAFSALFFLVFFGKLLAAESRPNILLLLSDDHSYPLVGCYGSKNVTTPTLDQFAAEGMICHRFFTTAPQCVPSRASLMTGRSPVACRMTRFSSPLPRDEITLPELLREKGNYYTGICGRSFHLDGPGNARQGAAGIGQLIEEHKLKTFSTRVDFLNTCPDNQVAQQMEKFLQQKPKDRPFFMWASFSDPHHVWDAPKEFRPDPSKLELPPHWPDMPMLREQIADYCAEVNRLDKTVASVFDLLKKEGYFENTLILFLGDNGAALPHGKGSLYDPGSNVPCLIRWPGKIQPKSESRALLSGEDVAPTLLAAAGIEPGSKMSGVSFLPMLQGKAHDARKYIFVERGPHGSAPVAIDMSNNGYDLARSVRSDRYKFIYNCTPWIPYAPVDSANGPGWKAMKEANQNGTLAKEVVQTYFSNPRPVYELYDLESDPSELKNRSGDPALTSIEKQLRRALAEKMLLDCDYLPFPQL